MNFLGVEVTFLEVNYYIEKNICSFINIMFSKYKFLVTVTQCLDMILLRHHILWLYLIDLFSHPSIKVGRLSQSDTDIYISEAN